MRRNSGTSPSMRKTIPPADVSRVARARDMRTSGTSDGDGRHGIVLRGPPFDELPHDRVRGVVDLLGRAFPPNATPIEHGDACADSVRAPHVVRDDHSRDVELLAHAD